MELRPHQVKTVAESPNKWGLWFRMRVGKTPTAIRLASSRVKSALVVCPKSLTEQWRREIEKWNDSDCVFKVISREAFRRDWAKLGKYEALIIDEAHRAFANHRSLTFKAAKKYIDEHKTSHIWLLTGTPFTATSWSVYSYGLLLGKEWAWRKWYTTFFYEVKMGVRRIPMPKIGMDERLQGILKSIGTVIDLKDVADIAEDEDVFEYFDLNKEQKKEIEALTDVVPISRYTHVHELESGVLKGDEYRDDLRFECDKDKRLMELVNQNDKIIIVARYLNQIEKYERLIRAEMSDKQIFIIRGGTKELAGDIALQAESASKAVILIQSDTCDGYDLKSFDTVIFTSLSYSFVNYDQIRFRSKSSEKTSSNTYIHLITRGKDSMDQAVYNSVSKKQNFSIELYEKIRSEIYQPGITTLSKE